MLPIIKKAASYLNRTAVIDPRGRYSYAELLRASERIALLLLNGRDNLNEARIGFMVGPGFEYAFSQWGIWRAGGIAVPISVSHPLPSIRYVLEDAQVSHLIVDSAQEPVLRSLATEMDLPLLRTDDSRYRGGDLPTLKPESRAMILYTSGTTGKPKGVVSTHASIEAQIRSLVQAWNWTAKDHILNVLPLHHVHGIVNIMSCAFWSGACCQFLPKFEAKAVFEVFLQEEVNVFMAVPTIYYKLIAFWEQLPEKEQLEISVCLRRFRLMVSGSAALPVSVLEKWEEISGHTLLERYGMTEMGMAISNPYEGERRPGHIGLPLPEVEIRLTNEQDYPVEEGESGEIQVKGPNVFREYWHKPQATDASFTPDGWFKTGDIATLTRGYYRILGRNSVDIIKSGGYKISALEIEEVLRGHPQIKDCGVVGIPNEEWGEIVGASLVLQSKSIDLNRLKAWLRERLPAYMLPRKYIIQDDLPRNVMGKVTKHELKGLFQ
jgi:malonyl-CoA/methylmalonyl-CoA synthetase